MLSPHALQHTFGVRRLVATFFPPADTLNRTLQVASMKRMKLQAFAVAAQLLVVLAAVRIGAGQDELSQLLAKLDALPLDDHALDAIEAHPSDPRSGQPWRLRFNAGRPRTTNRRWQ